MFAFHATEPASQLRACREQMLALAGLPSEVSESRALRRKLRHQKLGEVLRLLESLTGAAQGAEERMRLRHPVEHGIGLGHVGANGPQHFIGRNVAFASMVRGFGLREGPDVLVDLVEMGENGVDLFARETLGAVAVRRQRILDRMRAIGNLRLPDHAGGALEGMSEAQQPLHRSRAAPALLKIEDAFRELIQKIARFDPKVFVGVLSHASPRP